MSITRLAGTAHLTEALSMDALKELWDHLNGVISLGRISAGYQTLINVVKPFVKLWYLKEAAVATSTKAQVSAGAVGALLKYWVIDGWGEDLYVHPGDNSVMLWKVTDKSKKYRNRDGILPVGQAGLANSEFREYRPATSYPGTYRLIEGRDNWWFTDNGTHGNTAACRGASWWQWPKNNPVWRTWTIAGTTAVSGAGASGAVVNYHPYVRFTLSDQESALVKLLKANATRFDDDDVDDTSAPSLFGSRVLWADAGNNDVVAVLH